MKTISEKKVLSILGKLYENAKDGTPESWLAVYQQMSALVSAGPGSLNIFMSGSGRFEVFASDLDPAATREFDEHYQFENPLRESVVRLKPGQSMSRLQACPDDEFEKTPIYQDYFRKLDIYQIEHYALGQMPGMTGGLSLSRPKSNPVFAPAERKVLDFLVPHVERAFQLYLLLNEAYRENRQMTQALSKIPQSVIVLDCKSKVVFRNESAEKMIDQKDGLQVHRGFLQASFAQDTKKLCDALSNVFALGNRRFADPVGVIQLARPSGRRPLQLLIAPFLKGEAANYAADTLALVFVFDPEIRPATEEDILRRIYSLTPAEARLTALIAQGLSTKEASEALNVTENTVRTHLKRIFSKTDTNRQGDLVNLVLNGPANLKNHCL